MTLSRSSALLSKLRERKCSNCGERFQQHRLGQQVCSAPCATSYARRLREQKERKDIKARKAALKTKGDWLKEAQAAFNAFIRERDRLAGHPCICCGQPLDWSGNNVDAGHYRSRGSAPHLRFDELNVHAQTKKCNRYGAGRAVDYRIGLIARIGLDAVEALEADNEPRHWSIADLQRIRDTYRAKLRELKKEAA